MPLQWPGIGEISGLYGAAKLRRISLPPLELKHERQDFSGRYFNVFLTIALYNDYSKEGEFYRRQKVSKNFPQVLDLWGNFVYT